MIQISIPTMQCECKLPCRDDPVNESDACYCTALLLLGGAVSVYMISNGYLVQAWAPLAVGTVFCGTIGGYFDNKRYRNRRAATAAVPA